MGGVGHGVPGASEGRRCKLDLDLPGLPNPRVCKQDLGRGAAVSPGGVEVRPGCYHLTHSRFFSPGFSLVIVRTSSLPLSSFLPSKTRIPRALSLLSDFSFPHLFCFFFREFLVPLSISTKGSSSFKSVYLSFKSLIKHIGVLKVSWPPCKEPCLFGQGRGEGAHGLAHGIVTVSQGDTGPSLHWTAGKSGP